MLYVKCWGRDAARLPVSRSGSGKYGVFFSSSAPSAGVRTSPALPLCAGLFLFRISFGGRQHLHYLLQYTHNIKCIYHEPLDTKFQPCYLLKCRRENVIGAIFASTLHTRWSDGPYGNQALKGSARNQPLTDRSDVFPLPCSPITDHTPGR